MLITNLQVGHSVAIGEMMATIVEPVTEYENGDTSSRSRACSGYGAQSVGGAEAYTFSTWY